MNLMVSGTNLVKDGSKENVIAASNTEYAAYELAPSSNNGELVKDYGYLVPGQTYTILIELMLESKDRAIIDEANDYIGLYTGTLFWCSHIIPKINERCKKIYTFKFPKTYSEKDYLEGIENDSFNALIRLTSGIYNAYSADDIIIYNVRIVEGDHTDDIDSSGLVTSNYIGDAMSWSITPDYCAWWNQDTTQEDPLMRLDSDGLYVKGEIEAIAGKFGCLNIESSGRVYYKSPDAAYASFYVSPTHGVSISKGQIGGWAVDESFNRFKSATYTYHDVSGTYTEFTPKEIKVTIPGYDTYSCSWADIIGVVNTVINPSTASVEESE
jgi:hypothetical protein